MSVLFFHADIELFSGGYVGVDIFFVISGYLITSIILKEVREERFSISSFYERRFRRILPALVFVVFSSVLVGYFILGAEKLVDLSESIIANAFFSSNMYFYYETGYFDGPAELKPLLHTWSLAVEEQFYILLPFLIIFLYKYNNGKFATWFIVLATLSFIANLVGLSVNPSATFYFLPTRAWELLIGSILALNLLKPINHLFISNLIAFFGIILLLVSIFLLSRATPFPGAAALLPTLGAALIIYAGSTGETHISRLLSNNFLVFIGLISYSLYLWHWPVIVYAKYITVVELDASQKITMLAAITLLSILSWRYVESPFRKKYLLKAKKSIFKASFSFLIIIVLIGSIFINLDGLPQRYESVVSAEKLENDTEWKFWLGCGNVKQRLDDGLGLCKVGDLDMSPSFFFWGDSHASALSSAVDKSAVENNIAGETASLVACPPLIGVDGPRNNSCNQFNSIVLDYLNEKKQINTVFLSARWTYYANGGVTKKNNTPKQLLFDVKNRNINDNKVLLEIGLKEMILALINAGKKVVVVKNVPEIGYDVPSTNMVAYLTDRDTNKLIGLTPIDHQEYSRNFEKILARIPSNTAIATIDPAEILCSSGYCQVVKEHIPLYRDDNHLSTYGSKYISSLFNNYLK